MRIVFLVIMAGILAVGCGDRLPPVAGCSAVGDLVPVCGLSRPEDMELLPDGHTLVISQMGTLDGARAGSLALYDTATGIITELPPFTDLAAQGWGAADCPGAPGDALAPHGIHLSQRPDGQWQLLAVNHGGGERVEFFEVATDGPEAALVWRGCAIPPPGSFLNDVVALPDGGFLATNMYDRNGLRLGPVSLALVKGMLGFDTGYVLRWDGTGFETVTGTGAPLPNGLQLSPDGRHLYLNAYLAGEVRKISYPHGRLEATAEVAGPDNSQWDRQGRLLVASQVGSMSEIVACGDIEGGACGAPFEIVALDPVTLARETLLRHQGAPMGAATVAQPVGDFLYIGSFVGDRMLRVPMPAGSAPTALPPG